MKLGKLEVKNSDRSEIVEDLLSKKEISEEQKQKMRNLINKGKEKTYLKTKSNGSVF